MASTKRFATGGGFPFPGSPRRQIEFTLSYGKSNLLDPNSTPEAPYEHRIEFSDPEDPAYVCAMYGPPRDEVGLRAFKDALAKAHKEVAGDPAYTRMPVPPLPFNQSVTAEDRAQNDIDTGAVARSCLWAQQFAPGANVSISLPRGVDANGYRAQARDNAGHLVAEHSEIGAPSPIGTGFDTSVLPSWMRDALRYQPQSGPLDAASSNQYAGPVSPDPGFRYLRRVDTE